MDLPRRAYVDQPHFELDEAIFRASWIPVAHGSEVAAPGSWVTSTLAGDRIAVVRGADLELTAVLDGCLHRGTLLFPEASGRCEKLSVTCPYHGLRYDLRGRVDPSSCPSIPLPEEAALRRLRVAERFGFVFVCGRSETPCFEEWAGAEPPWLQRSQLHALRLGRRVEHEVEANWKLLVENFQESHHFTLVHPSLESHTPWADSSSVDFGGAFLGGQMQLLEEALTVSDSPGFVGRPFITAEQDRRSVHDALLFPAWLTSLQPDYFLSYRLTPLGPTRTRITADIYFHAAAFNASFDPSAVYSFWDRTNAEDRAICELQQRGLASPSVELGPYASVEDGVRSFDQRVARAYAALQSGPEFPSSLSSSLP